MVVGWQGWWCSWIPHRACGQSLHHLPPISLLTSQSIRPPGSSKRHLGSGCPSPSPLHSLLLGDPSSLPGLPTSPDEQMPMCPHEQTFKGLMVVPEIKSTAGLKVWGAWPVFQLLPSSPLSPSPLAACTSGGEGCVLLGLQDFPHTAPCREPGLGQMLITCWAFI